MSSKNVDSKVGHVREVLVQLPGLITLLVFLTFILVNNAYGASNNCITWDWKSTSSFKSLDNDARGKIEKLRQSLCREMEAGKYDKNFVNNFFDAALLFKASCKNGEVNHGLWKNVPDAARHFCSRADKDRGNLIFHVHKFRADIFCEFSRDITDPDGWAGFFMSFSPELPSDEKLKAEALSLCSKVRSSEITPADAWQRFEQERDRAQGRIAGELIQYGAKSTVSNIVTLFKALAIILGIIATIITIMLGIKKLNS